MEPTLYIMMRKDIPDLNPGKLGAQAAHAQAEFSEMITLNSGDKYLQEAFFIWKDGRAFGRTLVLEATLDDIKYINDMYQYSGITVDPTYPWRNFFGEVVLSDIPTCGWTFTFENPKTEFDYSVISFYSRLKQLPLHR